MVNNATGDPNINLSIYGVGAVCPSCGNTAVVVYGDYSIYCNSCSSDEVDTNTTFPVLTDESVSGG